MALPWWQHHKHCLGYYIYYIIFIILYLYLYYIIVAQAGSLLAGTDFFFRVLLPLGPALSNSDSVWPHASECAALNFRVVWWSGRKSLLAPSLTSSSLWLEGRVAAYVTSICLSLCVSVTLSVNSPTGQTPERIFTVDSLKDEDLCKDVPFGGLDD